jgi:hypothetical protein
MQTDVDNVTLDHRRTVENVPCMIMWTLYPDIELPYTHN